MRAGAGAVRTGRSAPVGRRDQRGAVTAETAMVLPLLVVLTVALVWMLSLGLAQVRAVDAARETARALARDDSEALARELGARAAPDGARIGVTHDGDRVVVTVTVTASGLAGLLSALPSVEVQASAVAVLESS